MWIGLGCLMVTEPTQLSTTEVFLAVVYRCICYEVLMASSVNIDGITLSTVTSPFTPKQHCLLHTSQGKAQTL
ncbi:hypothetical protein BDQ94DRAFT_138881 [Aspergillus welwitschiae]|uniref:Uncharacterized protein n=1 Tax=Aspergillus welwitschiae TaxID=1341132 RepID=A0A3F3QAW1_9EURO|nr:hypothetical protein BDQ94DRAFT_138881 [Aspergillus welwitschiae]RDH36313.1 hypothetical protein BDQ94DRAFT_138881 [Aspergillus welwitschiae]